jgi:MFS family permease
MYKRTFLALFAVVFVTQIGIGIVAPLMPLYAERMGASGLWLGIMFSSYAAARMIFMPVTGRLSDVRGRKRFIAIGLFAYTIISIFYAWAPNIVALTIIRLFHGLASSMVVPIAQAYAGDLAPKGKEGTYINLFSVSMFSGMGFGPFLGGVLTDVFNMNIAFYAMSALSSIALLLLIRFVPAMEPSSKEGSQRKAASVRTIIRDSGVQAASIFRLSRAFWRQGIIAFLPLLAISSLQMTPAGIGLILSIYIITGAAVQGVFGPVVDRLNKVTLITICGVISPVFLFLIPYVYSGGTLLALLLLIAIVTAVGRGAMLAVNVETGKRYRGMGTVMGILNSAGSLGRMAGPMALGFSMDIFGLQSVFGAGAIIGIIGGLVTAYLLIKPAAISRQ